MNPTYHASQLSISIPNAPLVRNNLIRKYKEKCNLGKIGPHMVAAKSYIVPGTN